MISSTLLILKFLLLGAMYLFILLMVVLIVADLRRSGRRTAETAEAPRHYLAVIGGEGPGLGQRFLLADDAVIGRQPDNDITLDDPSVSSHHARLRLEAGGYVLEDLGSTNGTLLNGAQIAGPAAVRPGDKLKLGRMILMLEAEGRR